MNSVKSDLTGRLRRGGAVVAWFAAGSLACVLAAAPVAAKTMEPDPDPWRGANERIFSFNEYFDKLILRPIARAYEALLPPFVRRGIGNFFANIYEINVLANDLLQGKVTAALNDGGRFLINSTVGVGGLFDVATDLGLQRNHEDFGQTLGVWGVGPGPYMVLPGFGSSNLRDSFGFVLDSAFNPARYADDAAMQGTLFLLNRVDGRASLLPLDELVMGDHYLFYRDAYLQNREYMVKDGEIDDEFDDFDDF